jgi:hypothetical protein
VLTFRDCSRFLERKVLSGSTIGKKEEVANRAYPREQAFGDALDADKLEQL